jgi:hypothetical protein
MKKGKLGGLLLMAVFGIMSFNLKTDLVLKCDVSSCDKYRNVKVVFVNCRKEKSEEYITSCVVGDGCITLPSVLSFPNFKKSYESAEYMKIKLLRGTICEEQTIKL